MRLSKHHQMTNAPEGMEMDDVGAHDLAVESGVIEENFDDDEAASDIPPEEIASRTASPGAMETNMVIEEYESAEDAREALIKEITSHTYDVDEHEYMASFLETLAKEQTTRVSSSSGNTTEVSALKDRLMSGPKTLPSASTSMEVRPTFKDKVEPPTVEDRSSSRENGVVDTVKATGDQLDDISDDDKPDPNELWMCPATGVTMPLHKRAEYLEHSADFKECWQRVLATLVEKLGKRDVEKRVARLHRGDLCTAEEAFCALAESSGDLDRAAEKLHSRPYREEMALAARACELQKYVSTKRKKKQKKKKGRKSIAADVSDDHDERESSDIEPRRSRQRRPKRTTAPPGYGL